MNERLLFWDDLARLILGMTLAIVIFCAGWFMRGTFDHATEIVNQVDTISESANLILNVADSIQTIITDHLQSCGEATC